MLSLEDCIAFSGLTPDQLEAVACFKHIPVIVAAEWAETALDSTQGTDEIEFALASEASMARAHHLPCCENWTQALADFRQSHPRAA